MRLKAFKGVWRVERVIADARGGRSGRFSGQARFAPVADGLAYREKGVLRLDGAPPMAASRRYHWRQGEGAFIEVFFAEGGFFHRFRADEPRPQAFHDCATDRYAVRYDLRRWPRWRAEWRVLGPRKDYTLSSVFLRLDSAAGLGQERG